MRSAIGLLGCVLLLSACPEDKKPAEDSPKPNDPGKQPIGSKDAAVPEADAGPDAAGQAGAPAPVDAGEPPEDSATPDPGPVFDPIEPAALGGDLAAPGAAKDWTLFVYGHADHNLSNSFVRDVLEMADATIDAQVNVIVLVDFDASQGLAGTSERFPSGAEWLRIAGGGAEPETLATEDELDLDDPAVLAGAVAAAFERFPAEHRAVILWDHGGAWIGGFGGDSQNGTRAEPHPMSPRAVASAVAAGLQAAGVDIEGPAPALDLFSFDTCLMAGAEVAYEFRTLSRAYIANAEIDYGDGWDYTGFLSYLSSHRDEDALALARTEVALWDEHHADASFNDALLRSHVAIDTAALTPLASALETFVDSWLGSETLSGVELGRASYFSLPPYMNQLENPQSAPELRDIGQFLSAMAQVSDADVAMAADAARDALAAAVVARSQGSLRDDAQQLGVHVELPLAANMSSELLRAYGERAGAFAAASGWQDALSTYAKLDDAVAPPIRAQIFNDETPDAEHLPTVEFAAEGDDVAEAQVDLATLDPQLPDTLVFFGIVGKSAIDPDSTYQFEWDGQLMALPDGAGGLQAAYVALWEDIGEASGGTAAPVLASFGLVETGGQQVLGALLFQDGDAETALLTLLDPPVTLPLADVAQDLPGTTFTPVLVAVDLASQQQSFVPGTPIALDNASIPLSKGPAAAGSYALVTSIGDVFGNSSSDVQIANLPQSIGP